MIDEIGQKNIVHDYAHTSSRYVEQQGKKPFSATLDIFFTGFSWRADYKSFRAALEDPSPGRLILPTFGVINNVVAISSNASTTQTEIGEISLSVTFTETIERPSPTESDATSEDVFAKGSDSRSNLSESFTSNFQSPSTLNNKLTARSDFLNLAAIVNDVTGLAFATASFTRNLPKYLNSPAGMGALLLSQISPIGLLQSFALQNTSKSFSNSKKIAIAILIGILGSLMLLLFDFFSDFLITFMSDVGLDFFNVRIELELQNLVIRSSELIWIILLGITFCARVISSEIIFRGVLHNTLKQKFRNNYIVILIVSLTYSAIMLMFSFPYGISLFLLNFLAFTILGFLYEINGNIYNTMIASILYNILILILISL